MRVVPFDYKIFALEIINRVNGASPFELWKWTWLSLELRPELVDVVAVDMHVPELDHEFVRLGASDVRDHMREEGVGRNIERDAEPKIGRVLVHEAGESRGLTVGSDAGARLT